MKKAKCRRVNFPFDVEDASVGSIARLLGCCPSCRSTKTKTRGSWSVCLHVRCPCVASVYPRPSSRRRRRAPFTINLRGGRRARRRCPLVVALKRPQAAPARCTGTCTTALIHLLLLLLLPACASPQACTCRQEQSGTCIGSSAKIATVPYNRQCRAVSHEISITCGTPHQLTPTIPRDDPGPPSSHDDNRVR